MERIFDLAVHGRGAASITRILIEEKVPTPGYINFRRDKTFANIYANAPEEKSYAWTIAQVKSILKDETYIGHTIHYQETNISFKNKRRIRKPQSDWVRVENTQEPIISEQVFNQVQEQIASRRRKCKDGTTQIFSGLVKCADCGWSLSSTRLARRASPALLTASTASSNRSMARLLLNVRIFHVSNNDTAHTFSQIEDGIFDSSLCNGIQITGCLIQYKKLWVL